MTNVLLLIIRIIITTFGLNGNIIHDNYHYTSHIETTYHKYTACSYETKQQESVIYYQYNQEQVTIMGNYLMIFI